MQFIIFLIILFLIWLIFGERIKRWMAGYMARRTEDYLRKAAGLPPRPGSKEARRQERARENVNSGQTSSAYGNSDRASAYSDSRRTSGSSRRRRRTASTYSGPLIPKEYAVDVEFVETINYSETTIGVDRDRQKETVYHESQVSDVEWEDIRIRKK